VGHFPRSPFNRPMCAHFSVMSPRSVPCSSAPFCTSGVATSRAFWSYSGHASKVLTTLVVVECSQVRQLERKEEMRACPATTKTNLAEHRTWTLAGILPSIVHNPQMALPGAHEMDYADMQRRRKMSLLDRLRGKKGTPPEEPRRSDTIELFHKSGATISVSREEWRTKSLPATISSNWHDPEQLSTISRGLRQ